jgi:hypothetical protein
MGPLIYNGLPLLDNGVPKLCDTGVGCCETVFTECGDSATPGDLSYILSNLTSAEITIARGDNCLGGGAIDCSPVEGTYILGQIGGGVNQPGCPVAGASNLWSYPDNFFSGVTSVTGCTPSEIHYARFYLGFHCLLDFELNTEFAYVILKEYWAGSCLNLAERVIPLPASLSTILSGNFTTLFTGNGCDLTSGSYAATA